MSIFKSILSTSKRKIIAPESLGAIYFNRDESNYLKLVQSGVGGTDKFIISFWFKLNSSLENNAIFRAENASGYFITITRNSSDKLFVYIKNSINGVALTYTSPESYGNSANWHHFALSYDYGLGTGNLTVNDNNTPFSLTGDDGLDLTYFTFGGTVDGQYPSDTALVYCYIASGEYLDFSVPANREKFAIENEFGQLVPVDLRSNGSAPTGTPPVIYLPLDDLLTIGENKGSGGDFTENGAFNLASTSPGTPSVEAVYFNGTDNNLATTNIISGVDSFLASMWLKPELDSFNTISIDDNTALQFQLDNNGELYVVLRSSSNTLFSKKLASSNPLVKGLWQNILVSWDSVTGDGELYINDIQGIYQISTNLSGTMDDINSLFVGSGTSGNYYGGDLSEFFLSSGSYLDLSVESNRRLFINADLTPANTRQLHINSGITPDVYLPNPSANCEVNFGTGGDFTQNGTLKNALSTPLYYYANPAFFNGSNTYLVGTSPIGANSTSCTVSVWMNFDVIDGNSYSIIKAESGLGVLFSLDNGEIKFMARNDAFGTVKNAIFDFSSVKEWVHIVVSFTATILQIYVNGSVPILTTEVNNNDTVVFDDGVQQVGANGVGGGLHKGDMAELFYASGQFIDLSNPDNLAKFITPDGRPAGNLIETTGLTPEVYLTNPFDSFEKNLGSGSDFTVTGILENGTNSPSDSKELI